MASAACRLGFFARLPAREPARNTLSIGLAEEPRTLNVWLASDANSRKVLSLIYQPLYMYDPDTLDLVPWLAASMPVYDHGAALSYTIDPAIGALVGRYTPVHIP
jgi:ABC-type transport system substrate-binding protein